MHPTRQLWCIIQKRTPFLAQNISVHLKKSNTANTWQQSVPQKKIGARMIGVMKKKRLNTSLKMKLKPNHSYRYNLDFIQVGKDSSEGNEV